MKLRPSDIRELAAALADELEARGIVAPRMRAPGAMENPACNDELGELSMDPTHTASDGVSSFDQEAMRMWSRLEREKKPKRTATPSSSRLAASRRARR